MSVESTARAHIPMDTALTQFSDAIRQSGIIPPEHIISDSEIHRFPSDGKRGDDAGWYVYYAGDLPAGTFGCWRSGIKETWRANIGRQFTPQENAAYKERLQAIRRAQEQEKKARNAEARAKTQNLLQVTPLANDSHTYLQSKKVKSHGLHVHNGDLVVPAGDISGEMRTLQFISADGEKKFLYGGQVKGCFHLISKPDGVLCITEGYATAATIYEATGYAVAVAFNAGNLIAVAEAFRQKYPDLRIIMCADDDWKTAGNPGLTKATEAARVIGGLLAIPAFESGRNDKATDFNDMAALCGIEAVKAQLVPVDDWQEPEKIEHTLPPVPPLPESIIPEPFRLWIADVAYRMQCPPDIAAAAAIVMTGSVIGAGCGIRPKCQDDWLVIPNLYGGGVGRPSILMKSPTLAEMLKPIALLEAKAKEAHDTAQRYHEADMAEVGAKRKGILKSMEKATSNAETLKDQYAALQDPEAPKWRRYRTNNATIEKLSELLNENPRGLLVFRDELTGLLTSWEKDGHEADRAYFLEAWNGSGDDYTDRIGRGTTYTKNMCLSVFGGIQPAKMQHYLYANRLINDGMFQRFQVLVYPDEPKGWALIDQNPDREAKNRAYEIIEKLVDMNFIQYGATLEEGEKTPYFHFADDAQKVFNEWWTELETKKIRGNDEPMLVEHFGKYRKLMPTLALIFHLIMLADGKASGAVSKEAAELAAAWCDYLEAHARRIYGLVSSIAMQAAYNLSRHITKGEVKDRFTIRDIYHNQWSLLTDREMVQPACDILVRKGWLKEVETPAAFQQKAKTEYLINPKARGFYG